MTPVSTNLECVVKDLFVVRLGGPNSCPYAQLQVFDRETLQDEEFVLLRRAIAVRSCLHVVLSRFGGLFLVRSRLLVLDWRLLRCRCLNRRSGSGWGRNTSCAFHRTFAQSANEAYRLELGVVKTLLGRCAGRFIFEIGECAVALGDEEERFESRCFLAGVVNQAHEVGLGWKVSNPDRVPYAIPLSTGATWKAGGGSFGIPLCRGFRGGPRTILEFPSDVSRILREPLMVWCLLLPRMIGLPCEACVY
jgi:hypothetical protein